MIKLRVAIAILCLARAASSIADPAVKVCPQGMRINPAPSKEETGIALAQASVGHDGAVLSAKILVSSGLKKLDEATLVALQACTFAPNKPGETAYVRTWTNEFHYSYAGDPEQARQDRASYQKRFEQVQRGEKIQVNERPVAVDGVTKRPNEKVHSLNDSNINNKDVPQVADAPKTDKAIKNRKQAKIAQGAKECAAEETRLLSTIVNKQFLKANENFPVDQVPDYGSTVGASDFCVLRNVFIELSNVTAACNANQSHKYKRFVEKADELAIHYRNMSCPEILEALPLRMTEAPSFEYTFSVDNDESRKFLEENKRLRAADAQRRAGVRPQQTTSPPVPGTKTDDPCGDGRPRGANGICTAR